MRREEAQQVAEQPAKGSQMAAREQAALTKQHERRRDKVPVPRVGRDEVGKLKLDHANGACGFTLLMEGLGTADADFANGILKQIVNISSPGPKTDIDAANFVLGAVTGISPNDEVEAMLAMQMAAVHLATMTFARRLAHVENIPQQDSAERAFNKLARTFAGQVEALKRYRSKGEQRVYVERVDVRDGGQAIVGNVQGGGGQ